MTPSEAGANVVIRYQGVGMSKRRMWASLTVTAAALLSTAPAHAQSLLKVAPETLSRILDPHFTTSFTTRDLGYLVYDTLFAVDDKFEPRPQMVERYTLSPDKLTYTFVLRSGLKWHDGAPVTAADCVASIRRWASRDSMGQTLMKFVASLEAADADTIKLVLREPYGLVLDSLVKVGAPVPFMMPERIAKTPGSEQVKDVIGSGPYKFRADLHEPGVKIVLDKFTDYKPRSEPPNWASGGKIAKLDRIEMLGMPDAQTQVSALIRGEVDYLERVPADLLPLLDAKSGARAEVVSKFGFQAIMRMNHLQPPFDNPKARQAIAKASNTPQ
jgi:peptide/nickel transport system substrate-binding protein